MREGTKPVMGRAQSSSVYFSVLTGMRTVTSGGASTVVTAEMTICVVSRRKRWQAKLFSLILKNALKVTRFLTLDTNLDTDNNSETCLSPGKNVRVSHRKCLINNWYSYRDIHVHKIEVKESIFNSYLL